LGNALDDAASNTAEKILNRFFYRLGNPQENFDGNDFSRVSPIHIGKLPKLPVISGHFARRDI